MLTKDLRAIIARDPRGVAVIVGAGLTIGALPDPESRRLASWSGLIEAGITRAVELGVADSAEAARLRAALQSDDPTLWIAAGEAVTHHLGGPRGGEFARWLRETAGAFSGKIAMTPALEAVAGLVQRGALVATVNYDGVLEKATGLSAVTWREPAEVERVLRGDERAIIHLHGHWRAPESVVLGSRSYEEVLGDAHTQAVMRALRMSRTLIFVGHGAGLEDPNWGPFLRWTEAVFQESSYRHFRLVRSGEVVAVQAEHRLEQRIFAVPYGERHEDLGPFLRSLVPAGGALKASAPRRTAVLLVNVTEKDHKPLEEEEVREELEAQGELGEGIGEAIFIKMTAKIAKKEQMTPRAWRAIAREVERAAAELQGVRSVARYVVCGRAPLSVFAYLGRALTMLSRPITFMNVFKNQWERVTISEFGRDGKDHFGAVGALSEGSEAKGKVVLAVQCFQGNDFSMAMVKPALEVDEEAIIGGFGILAPERSKAADPMVPADLAALERHLGAAQRWISASTPNASGIVVALLGPAWVAFWLGAQMNRRARNGRIDFREFDPSASRYVPALSSPRHAMPWLSGRPRLLYVEAEPDELTRTRGEELEATIRGALAPLEGHYELRARSRVTPQILLEEIDALKPDILHVHMHGSERGVLAFEKDQRRIHEVSHETFVQALKSRRIEPTLVVISACHSAAMAQALGEVAECVITMRGEVRSRTAVVYARQIYKWLAEGRSLKDVLLRARTDVALEGMRGYEVITASSALEEELDDVVLIRGVGGRPAI